MLDLDLDFKNSSLNDIESLVFFRTWILGSFGISVFLDIGWISYINQLT